MRYLCLGYYDPEQYDALTEEERKASSERCQPHDEAFNATGKVVTVATLAHAAGARIRPTEAAAAAHRALEDHYLGKLALSVGDIAAR